MRNDAAKKPGKTSPLQRSRHGAGALVLAGAMLLASGSSATSTAQKKDPTIGGSKKNPAAVRAPRTKAAPKSKIIVSATPAESIVTLDDVAKQPGRSGQLELDIPIGETHELRVYAAADKYAPRTFEISVTEDESKQLTGKVVEKRAVDDPISDFPLLQYEQPVSKDEPLKLDVVLPPARAVFMIINAPVGADVTVDDKKVGAIGPDGSYVGKTEPGRRKISLAAEGYSFVAGEAELAAGASLHRINYNLSLDQQKKGAIEISGGVTRSQVLLRSHPRDPATDPPYVLFTTVTFRGRALVSNLVPGLYDLKIETPDKQQWVVESCLVASNKVTPVAYKTGSSAPVYRDLDQLAAAVSAEASAAETKPANTSTSNTPASDKAETEGAVSPPEALKPQPVPLVIEGDLKSAKVSFDEQPEFSIPDSIAGTQEIPAALAGQTASFKVEAQGASLKLSADDIGPGVHRIRISKKDFRPWSREFTASAGQPVSVAVKLEPIPWEELVFRWKNSPGRGPLRGAPALSVTGNRAYVLSENGALLAYDLTTSNSEASDHAPHGQFSVSDTVAGSPLVAPDGTIIVCQSNGAVHGIVDRGSTLEAKWQPNTEAKGSIVASAALASDGQNVIVGTSVGVVALSIASGTRAWRVALDAPVVSSPVVGADGTIYVLSGTGSLFAIRPDGQMKWHTPFAVAGAEGTAPPAIDGQGLLYVASQDGYLYAIRDNGASGEKVWQSSSRLGVRIDSSPVIASSGIILIASSGALVSAVDARGTVLWSYSKTSSPSAAEGAEGLSLATDGSIYAGLSEGGLLVLKQDGSLKGRFPASGAIAGAPLLAPDGTILFGSADGTFYVLKEENGGLSRTAPWPTAQHDEHRSGRAGRK